MNLVTGATGLLGSHLIFKLISDNKRVRAIRRKSSNLSNVESLFRHYGDTKLEKFCRVEWVEGDVLDYYSLAEAMQDVTTIYHCAASVSFYSRHHQAMWNVNVEGTRNMVDAALAAGVARFCHASSIATLGNGINGNATTEDDQWHPDDNHSVYSLSKFWSEMEVWQGIERGLNAIIVNPSVIIGPPVQDDSSTSKIIKLAASGMPFYTGGSTGYVDVRDVAKAMVMLADSRITKEKYIISAENLTTRQILGMMAERFNAAPPRYEVKKWMSALASGADCTWSLLTGKEPSLTPESLRAASGKSAYSSQKLVKETNIDFIPIREAINNAIDFYQKEKARH